MLSTGCTDNPSDNIKGYVLNNNFETCKVEIYRESTKALEDSVSVDMGETITIYLRPGDYEIKAYDSDNYCYASIDFTLTPGAEDFYITVHTNKVTARSN